MGKKNLKKNGSLFRGESNPFNIKVNRQKHSVLGSNIKGTKGCPGVSKAKSHTMRKNRWQKNRVSSQKSNRYLDKRSWDSSMHFDDQVTARFVRERQKKTKNSIFNLNDEEELTHKGEPLQNMKNFDDKESGSEEDEDRLDENFVSKAHFGGFNSESNFQTPKSHKEIVEQYIIESKQKKQERKSEKDKYISTQEMVDKEWKELHFANNAANPVVKTISKQTLEHKTKDIYDISKNELKFEPKGTSITYIKTPEAIAKEEEELYTRLEKERLSRMTEDGDFNNVKSVNHLSADGIYDFDYLEAPPVEESNMEVSADADDSDSKTSLEKNSSSDSEEDDIDSDINLQEVEEKCQEAQADSPIKVVKPNALDIPENIEIFRDYVKETNADQLCEIVEGILKNTIRSKSEKVLVKLGNFFNILMRYALECCEGKVCNLEKTGVLLPHLHSLAMAAPQSAAEKFLEILDQEQEIFQECKKQNLKCDFPRLQTLVVLKYSEVVFPVSDFRHPITTPSIILMCDILSSAFCHTYSNILSRLLVSRTMLNCVLDSQRFIPEAISFLNSVLKMAVPKKGKGESAVLNTKKFSLVVHEKPPSDDIIELDLLQSNNTVSEDLKIGILYETINQLHMFALLYKSLPSFKEIFCPTLVVFSELQSQFYPSKLQKLIQLLESSVLNQAPLNHLVFKNTKPKCLKMFEPSFQSKFDKRDDINRKRKLIRQVSQKIRKEEKGMLREIRRDAQMIASEKLKERLELDAERKRKVKELYGELATQEGEYKKMMKKKPL